jgi:nucleoside-diphosphate-sugar epimerase
MKDLTKPILLVTGISGLIGTKIAEALNNEYRVVGLDLEPTDVAHWIECDLTKDETTARAFNVLREKFGNEIASVVHLAAYYDFSGEPSPLYQSLTVQGTRRILKELQSFQVGQFIFSSSLLVMKPVEKGEVITENSTLQAEWDYPKSKLEAEKAIQVHRGNIPAVILRIAGVYNEDCNSIPISQQIKRIYEKEFESYFFPGNPEHGQSFVHLDDTVDSVLQTIQKSAELGPHEIFLIGEPETMSYEELQDRIGDLIHDKEWATIRIPKPFAKAGAWIKEKFDRDKDTFIKPWMIDLADAHYPVSIDKASHRLGWRPRHRLNDVLPEMVNRLVRNPRLWYQKNNLQWPEEKGEKEKESKRA